MEKKKQNCTLQKWLPFRCLQFTVFSFSVFQFFSLQHTERRQCCNVSSFGIIFKCKGKLPTRSEFPPPFPLRIVLLFYAINTHLIINSEPSTKHLIDVAHKVAIIIVAVMAVLGTNLLAETLEEKCTSNCVISCLAIKSS